MRAIVYALLMVCSGLLAGCFEVHQKVTVDESGSGTLLLDLGVSSTLMAFADPDDPEGPMAQLEALKQRLEAHPEVTAFQAEEFTESGTHHFIIQFSTADYERLPVVAGQAFTAAEEPPPADAPGLLFRFEPADGGVRFSQTMIAGATLQDRARDGNEALASIAEATSALPQEMVRNFLEGREFELLLEAPAIRSADGELNAERTRATWTFPMYDLVAAEQDQVLSAVIEADQGLLGQLTSWLKKLWSWVLGLFS